MRSRSWRWLRVRILGLLAVPPAFVARHTEEGVLMVRVPSTRIGLQLEPPEGM